MSDSKKKLYSYVAAISTRKGNTNLHIEAESIEKAKSMARDKGSVIHIKKVNSIVDMANKLVNKGMKKDDRQIFMTRLSSMLEAGLGLPESLDIISKTFKGDIRRVATRLLQQINIGADMDDAMELLGTGDFPSSTVALVRSGYRGGDTAQALKNAAAFEHEVDQIRRSMSYEFYMAIGGYVFAVAMIFATTRFMAPQLFNSPLFSMGNVNMSPQEYIDFGVKSEIAVYISSVFIFGLILLNTVCRRIAPVLVDNIILRIPYYKDLVMAQKNYSTFFGLALLCESGVSLGQALKLTAEASEKGRLREELYEAYEKMNIGQEWATSLKLLHPTDRAALSSSLDQEGVSRALKAISSQYRVLYGLRVKWLGPIMTLVAAGFVFLSLAVVFYMVMMPIMTFSGQILQNI